MKHGFLSGALFGVLSLLTAALAPLDSQAQSSTQKRHLVQFRDKSATPYSVAQPQQYLSARALQRRQRQGIAVTSRDFPPTPLFVQQVRGTGATVLYRTRWLNGVVVECDSAVLATIQALPVVVSAETLNKGAKSPRPPRVPSVSPLARRPLSSSYYGAADAQARQIGADVMHARGYRGEGMQIAVFDAGFPGVNQVPAFDSIRTQGRIATTFDFVDRDQTVYEKYDHGTEVLSCIGANQPNTFVGTAPRATFHLCITEDVRSEHHIEEANWLIAAEYADSVGADIISSSLGYTSFDPPSVSYTYADMNGRTALSTRAADLASGVGILVVNSAGNDGFGASPYIGAPADGDSVLTVGAVDSLGNYAGFSSQGPTVDGRVKPNLSAQGQATAVVSPSGTVFRGNGTSFSCPVLAGMAAGFWQAHPNLTARQVRLYLQASASQANAPDALLGYGIPNFRRADSLATAGVLGVRPGAAGPGLSAPELLPNPVPGGTFGIRLPARFAGQVLTLRVTDAAGRQLLQQSRKAPASSEPLAVDLGPTPLVPGIYLCHLATTDGSRYTLRFVKE